MTLGQRMEAARPRVVAALAARFRDLDLAEEGYAEACEAALRAFAEAPPPGNLAGWLYIAGGRKILDRKRREAAESRARAAMPDEEAAMDDLYLIDEPIPDERLRLIFVCCHPALAGEVRVALTLRVVCGVPTARIAAAFLVPEATMYQRLTRAKAKIRLAGVPFETPAPELWPERIAAVMATMEIAYALAYQDAGNATDSAPLGPEVARLSGILAELLPEDPEVLGLAALVRLAEARRPARVDGEGRMVPLSEQDTALWDDERIAQGFALLDRAARFERSGPFQLMAAIHAAHARRKHDGRANWDAIAALYDALHIVRPTPVVAVNRALAIGRAKGVQAGLSALDAIEAERLSGYRPYHAARAHLLAETGNASDALAAYDAALALDPPPAERAHLIRKRAALETSASRRN